MCAYSRKTSMRRIAGITVVFITAFLAAAVALRAVHLGGAGASFPSEVYKAWMVRFLVLRSEFTTLDMTYDAVGSGGGKARIKSGEPPVEYAGSDSLLGDEDYEAHSDLQMFPTLAGAVMVVFNIPGIATINLTRANVVDIFNGSVSVWNDTSIQQWNPAVGLPGERIVVVVRMDKSGTTEMFSSALAAFSPEWDAQYGVFSDGLDRETNRPHRWNPSAIAYYGYTNRGVSGLVMSLRYTISYLSPSDVEKDGLAYCFIQNHAGRFVRPTVGTVQNAMNRKLDEFDERFTVRLVDSPGEGSYPMAGYTYMIVRMATMSDCDAAHELYRYIEWFTTDASAARAAIGLHLVPLSAEVAVMIRDRVLRRLVCGAGGRSVHAIAEAEKRREAVARQTWRTPVYILVPALLVIIAAVVANAAYQYMKLNRALLRGDWKIPIGLIKISSTIGANGSSIWQCQPTSFITTSTDSTKSKASATSAPVAEIAWGSTSAAIGRYRGDLVSLRRANLPPDSKNRRRLHRELLWFKTSVHHSNLAAIAGMTELSGRYYYVVEHWNRSLSDVLQNERLNLDTNFKFSMSYDVACGMQHLHSVGVVHGNLSSGTCYIDVKWTVKITDWCYTHMAHAQRIPAKWARPRYVGKEFERDQDIQARELFWTAPELVDDPLAAPTREADTYSFAVLLVEIFSREDPYHALAVRKTPTEIIREVVNAGVRPALPDDYPSGIHLVTITAFSPTVEKRPRFPEIKRALKSAHPVRKGMLDCMMESIEKYMLELEEKVNERTTELAVAMRRMETLLHQMLPPEIAIKLSNGDVVEAEQFDDVTIFFSDIVGFTSISAESSPIEIVTFLNDLYTTFDDILDRRDVYKVETIGDAYMVSSGLPNRNGIAHAGHIATMALELMVAAADFRIRHRPDEELLLRIGMHSGPVCAGVVGIKMPRYCLFGDTVNTASRMESSSLAMKIQLTGCTRDKLTQIGGFLCVKRGIVPVKGKGTMNTFWLHGKSGMESVIPAQCTRKIDSDI